MGDAFARAPATGRDLRRAAERQERRAKRSGQWGDWRVTDYPQGAPGRGWLRQVTRAFANDLYAVLVRPLAGGVTHLAIRTATGLEPPWCDLQRIKNELMGGERFAVQVCPPHSRLIDEADMYHLWVMPEGHAPGFGLHPLDDAPGAELANRCTCVGVRFGEYDKMCVLTPPWRAKVVGIDRCLRPEIERLWALGIRTLESCCGHGLTSGYIATEPEFAAQMAAQRYVPDPAAPHVFLWPPTAAPTLGAPRG